MVNNLVSDTNSIPASFKNLPFLAARKDSKDKQLVKVIPSSKINPSTNLNQ